MKKIKVSTFGVQDMLKLKNLPKKRKEETEKQESASLIYKNPINQTVKLLHPKKDVMKLEKKELLAEGYGVFHLTSTTGQPLSYFKGGQYITLSLELEGSYVTRPYSLISTAKDAQKGVYTIGVKKDGFFSSYLIDTAKEGDTFIVSAPEGHFCYQPLRDTEEILAIGGGIGITPFLSMGKSINEGIMDCTMTLMYIAPYEKDLVLKTQVEELRSEKVNVVYLVTREKVDFADTGHITESLLDSCLKTTPQTVFICGPNRLSLEVESLLSKKGFPQKYIRSESFSSGKREVEKKDFTLTVHIQGEVKVIPCNNQETLLVSLEKGGIKTENSCKTGSCGFCHTLHQKGDFYEKCNKKRKADDIFGYLYTCSTYPDSDMEITVKPLSPL